MKKIERDFLDKCVYNNTKASFIYWTVDEMEAPPGYEFTGEFRVPKADEYCLGISRNYGTKRFDINHIVSESNCVLPRLILKPIVRITSIDINTNPDSYRNFNNGKSLTAKDVYKTDYVTSPPGYYFTGVFSIPLHDEFFMEDDGKAYYVVDKKPYDHPRFLLEDENGNTYNTPSRVKVNNNNKSTNYTYNLSNFKTCSHPATTPVIIGEKKVYLGACYSIKEKTFLSADYILPLNDNMPDYSFGKKVPIIYCSLPDRGGVPKEWEKFIKDIAKLIKSDNKILAYCTGSHGRTGTFGASLIAVMEPKTEDPIEAIRKRHCEEAVESYAQAEAIFKLKGQKVPDKYLKEFHKPSGSIIPTTYNSTNKSADLERDWLGYLY